MSKRSKDSKAGKRQRARGISPGEIIVGLIIVVFAIWAVYSFSQPAPATTTSSTTNSVLSGTAPDFTLPVVTANGLNGQKVSLSSFRGKVVLLEFMEPWCSHCQDMAPALESLYQQFGAQNVVFLSVAGSWSGASASDAAKFISDYHSNLMYVYDSSGTTFNAYGVTGTPTFFIIDKNGRIAATYPGEVSAQTLAADLTRLNG
jgi:peroxiredoxin